MVLEQESRYSKAEAQDKESVEIQVGSLEGEAKES